MPNRPVPTSDRARTTSPLARSLPSMPVWMGVGLVALLLGLAGVPAQAQAQADPTLWRCHLTSGATRLLCVAERSPQAVEAGTTASVPNASGLPARYPLDPSRPYTIELLGPATDMPLVAQLAQFTLCLKTPNCRAVVG
ncbi:hypothetical protein [Leptothrix discophora]|uniref:Uncharacterized protein n=1 Tax=Leptothrix discophora TaxID=89 RepID=A0ABT9FY20_LEPDI|nr:hypothetical protein [Leptothrix discophora]MDP4299124.1 hypothetical protein [Leptothrix discophora]